MLWLTLVSSRESVFDTLVDAVVIICFIINMAYQEKEHSPQEKHLSHESAEAVSKDHPTGPKIHEIEGLVVIGMDEDDLEFFHNFPQEQRSKLTRKVHSLTSGLSLLIHHD